MAAVDAAGYASLLQATADEMLGDDPGARLERERPGWYLTWKREPGGSVTLEARSQVNGQIIEENISRDEFERAIENRSQFVNVIRRAVGVLIQRIPVTSIVVNSDPNVGLFANGSTVTFAASDGALPSAGAQSYVMADGGKVYIIRRPVSERLREAARRIRDRKPMTEGEALLAGRRAGKSQYMRNMMFLRGQQYVQSSDLPADDDVSDEPHLEPEPLMPRPARVYCED